MTEYEVAWLAGLLEGEGSFLFAPPSAYKRSVGIDIQMTDEDIISRAARLMGVSYKRYMRKENPARKPVFQSHVRGRKAIDIMRQILPYMGNRRAERIKKLIETFESCPKSKYESKLVPHKNFILEKHKSGMSSRSISRILLVHHSAICRFLKEGREAIQ